MRGSAVANDSTGNIYLVGYIGTDVHILKYNTNGNLIWHRFDTLNTTGNGICAVADKQGNIYVTADGFSSPTGAYLRILKYDSTGTKIWLKYCFATEANVMCLDNVGNIYIAGRKTISGRYNYITLKYNPSGDTLWTATYGSPYSNGGSIANAICVDFQNNVYVTGSSINTSAHSIYVTLKYNSNGIQQWVARYDISPLGAGSGGASIAIDKYGYSYVTGGGYYDSTHWIIGTIKYTSNGDSVWTRLYIPPLSLSSEYGNNILLDSSLNVYVSGRGSDSSHPSGSFRTIKYNNNGNLLWTVSDTGGIMPNSMVLDKYSNIFLTGDDNGSKFYSVEYNTSGNKIWSYYYPPIYPARIYSGIKILFDKFNNLYIYGSSLDSVVMLKFSTLSDIRNISESTPYYYRLFQNYPNPFNPTTKIKFDIPALGSPLGRGAGGMTVLKVYDILGKEIETLVNEKLNPGKYEVTFNASKYPSGVYFYRLITDRYNETKKMIVLK